MQFRVESQLLPVQGPKLSEVSSFCYHFLQITGPKELALAFCLFLRSQTKVFQVLFYSREICGALNLR